MRGKSEVELIAQLETILKQHCIERLEETDDAVILKERDAQAKMKVEVTGISKPFLAIRLNKLSHLSALKDGGWKQICDYLLIGRSDGKAYAVFVELKKTLRGEEKPREQLLRSLPILKYLFSVCEIEAERDFSDWKADLTLRYVLIADQLSAMLAKQGVLIPEEVEQETYKSINVTTFAETPFLSISDMLQPETIP